MLNAAYCITHLGLIPHPEGGYYKETYRSEGSIEAACLAEFSGARSYATGIYFLLEHGNFSAFHRIKSDEMWHFYAGDPLEVIEISPQGKLTITVLGNDLEKGESFQYVVPAGHWFGSRVKSGGNFSLVGCTVAPGFDFADFEMADRSDFKVKFPYHSNIIEELTRV
jgi:predicted cupin superfamily sugar epimerase